MTTNEFKSIYFNKILNTSNIRHSNYNYTNSSIPSSIDWRASGMVTDIKDQGQCGSCWSFSAVVPMEGKYAELDGSYTSLSEQNISCTELPIFFKVILLKYFLE